MAHFAKVENNKVVNVIVAELDFFEIFVDTSPGKWIQTSYNTREGIHYGSDGQPDGGIALRGNYAGIDYNYDEEADIFYPNSPFPSWTLNKTFARWEAPVAMPSDGKPYSWNEDTLTWVEILV
jgi:hypothetical protein